MAHSIAEGQELSQLLVSADAQGDVLVLGEGLSFWGGVDPMNGRIIDDHHPKRGEDLSGRFVMMPTSRGSCSGSGVLLELALNGRAPAALAFREDEDILTLGALVASKLFDRTIPVLRLSPEHYDQLALADHASIRQNQLVADGYSMTLEQPTVRDLDLTHEEQRLLDGEEGRAAQLAMEVLCQMAAAQRATSLVEVSRAHIDGCIYAHSANLTFAQTMLDLGASVRVTTTMNAISVDRENWRSQGVPVDFGQKASRLADAYVQMGALPTYTCAPYLLADPPVPDERIGWSESNAVIYANSVLGARSQKQPDFLDLCVAITGRAPNAGVYLDQHRRPGRVIHVAAPASHDDSFWPLLGWHAGMVSPDRVPLLLGLENICSSPDDLKSFCAAFGTTSAAPLVHIAGHTPEAELRPLSRADNAVITLQDLADAWHTLNTTQLDVDLVAIGSPHVSVSECMRLVEAFGNNPCSNQVKTIVTIGRDALAQATTEGLIESLRDFGVQVISDICWCSITEPIFPPSALTLMTNSGKYAHYANGLTGRLVRFGSIADCVQAALTGKAPEDPPGWLGTHE